MAIIQKIRKSFAKSFLQTPLPDLVETQYSSYKDFLQDDVAPENRKHKGLQAVFEDMFPIHDYAGNADLEFMGYVLDKPCAMLAPIIGILLYENKGVFMEIYA